MSLTSLPQRIERFLETPISRFPGLSAWTQWCYLSAPALIYDHQHVFWSENGVRRATLGPFVFLLRPATIC